MNATKLFTAAALFVVLSLVSINAASAYGPNHGGYRGGDRYHDSGRYNQAPRYDNRHGNGDWNRYQNRTPYHRVGGYNSYGHSGYGVLINPHGGLNIRIGGCR